MTGFYSAVTVAVLGTAYGTAKVLSPSGPRSPGPPPVMPDQSSIQQAQNLQEAKDAALQQGRASTVLTGTGASSNTGDRLGP